MTGAAEPIVTLSEAQAFARVESGEEEALIGAMVRSGSAICEAFLRQIVIARYFSEELVASREWQRLRALPVRSIDEVTSDGMPVPGSAYASDIDVNGCGWIRVTDPALAGRIVASGSAGMAVSQNGVPEPIRHGVLRLVAHLYSARDSDGGEVPAAVTALWRPYRRMQLA